MLRKTNYERSTDVRAASRRKRRADRRSEYVDPHAAGGDAVYGESRSGTAALRTAAALGSWLRPVARTFMSLLALLDVFLTGGREVAEMLVHAVVHLRAIAV